MFNIKVKKRKFYEAFACLFIHLHFCAHSLRASELSLFVVRKVHVRHFDVISTFFRCLDVPCRDGCAHLLVLVRLDHSGHRDVLARVYDDSGETCCVLLDQLVLLEPAKAVDRRIPLCLLPRVAIPLRHHAVMVEEDLYFGQLDCVLRREEVDSRCSLIVIGHGLIRLEGRGLLSWNDADRRHLLAQSQLAELLYREEDVSGNWHVWSDLVQIREQLEVFLRLLGQLLAEFGDVKEERCQEVLKDAENLLDAAVDEYRPDEGLKDVAHDLARLKDLDLSIVHPEVLLEGIADVAVQVVLLVQLLLVFLALLVLLYVTGSRGGLTASAIVTVVARLALFVEDVLLDAEEGDQLRQEVILGQQAFGLVGVERLEVLLGDVGLVLALLYVVFFEHSVLDEIRVGDVVKNGVAEDLHLLVARGKPICLLEAAMGQGLKEQILVRELEIEDLLYWRAD